MTIKEQLLRELETAPQPVTEEVFDFLLLAKIKHHRSSSYEQSENTQLLGAFAEKLVADIPEEVLNELPTDSAEQHDHYIYGTPKR
ncbi:MAG: hypothetical protein GVY04_15350 [Cyanobacteria bacterium]|jgi:hypothetical protein|nr:hypothetical protein [Cyanobacteria bacterium GSL.Bin1]